jgi:hypothetical protein
MASPQAFDKLFANATIRHYDFDPDGPDPVDVAWVDMQNFRYFAASFFRTIGTGALDRFRIIANPNSDGSGTDVVIKEHALTSQPDAVGDQVFLECQAEEIIQEGNDAGVSNVRYVSVQLEFATGTDEGVVTYIRHSPRFAHDGLTVDIIA